ncbi:CBY1-interacting BAR domain-containing protein 1 [Parasteatoda tepidariorum]|uniref:CBY1-interacting BAR domain-containing protein 1 n=1 Tax=Parasteatoda tepidariorum TaxID=114398 RepID=UPI0039BD6CF3
MAVDLRSSELENTFIKERISNVEKHTNSICSKFSIYNKKLASLKDSGDDLAKSLQNFISKETLNQSFKFAIHELSDTIASLQNDREAQIQYIEANAIQELKSYGPICKRTKDEFKKSYEAKLLDIKKQNQLQKLQAKDPPDLQKITHVSTYSLLHYLQESICIYILFAIFLSQS